MKHSHWIFAVPVCAALTLAACDQAQTPTGQTMDTGGTQGTLERPAQAPTQNREPVQDMRQQGQAGSDTQPGDASQSSSDAAGPDLAKGFALLDGSRSDSSTRWTLVSIPADATDTRSN